MSWLYTARDFRWKHKKMGREDGCYGRMEAIIMTKFVELLSYLAKDISYLSEKIQGISETFGCGNHVCRFEPAAMEIQ